MTGTKNLENAIDYMVDKFEEDEIDVRTEDVEVQLWVSIKKIKVRYRRS